MKTKFSGVGKCVVCGKSFRLLAGVDNFIQRTTCRKHSKLEECELHGAIEDAKNQRMDTWLAVNVMGWKDDLDDTGCFVDGKNFIHRDAFHPTTDRAASMEVLEKLVDNNDVTIRAIANQLLVSTADNLDKAPNRNMVNAGTLPLAIALFAKKIYETKT